MVSLATAHPAKFSKSVYNAIKIKPLLPSRYKNIFNLEEKFKVLDNNYKDIKNYIFSNTL